MENVNPIKDEFPLPFLSLFRERTIERLCNTISLSLDLNSNGQ